MALMPITDAVFLIGESREHPLHVGALQLYELPAGAGPDHVGELHRELLAQPDVAPLFRRCPGWPVSSLGQWAWADDDQLDLEYHVRLSALPTPGRVRELLELTSRLHGSLLDRHRPLWEFHVVEGLEGNRFATYTKVHHALLDGVSALRLLQRSLSADPDERGMPAPWAPRPGASDPADTVHYEARAVSDIATLPLRGLAAAVRAVGGAVGELVSLAPALARSVNDMLGEQAAMLPFRAPKSMLNVPITGARRFAAQGWPLERIRAVGRAGDATLNDVVLAMCAGALRQYLLELGALPEQPLVAAVPVSLRRGRAGRDSAGGNAVGLILCTLATHLADPVARLIEISGSMRRGKQFYAGMSQSQITALSAIPIVSLALTPIPGMLRIAPPPFNLIISNVPGPPRPLYFNGARMQGVYPVSVPYEGQALNITVTSYAGSLEFGLVGCRRSVPHLQRMLGHLETALADLEKATGAD
ncbi:MAG: wax ester/triacylglycerol synthase family O-acyltransferase [Micromonosporaceae bacterium]|nr:wax ester/triacylglycerol synthase family O-acyltransferase [Micromonosporaceae bacterium]